MSETNKLHTYPEFEAKAYKTWLTERMKALPTIKKSRFLVISREFGCDGLYVAQRVSELIRQNHKQDWFVFSHTIMEKIIADEKLGADMIHSVSEHRYSFINWFIDDLVPEYMRSKQSQAFDRMQTLILNLAEKGNCIFIGGGAQIITRPLDPEKFDGVRVRLSAPFDFRVFNYMKKMGVPPAEADKVVREKQNARDEFVRGFTGHSGQESTLYHLIFNNELSPPETISQTVHRYLELQGFWS